MNEIRNDACLFDEVTKHQAADKWGAAWDEDAADESDDDREKDLLALAHFAEGLHLDGSLFLGGHKFDDWREDDWDKGHVAICGKGDASSQFRSGKLVADENGGWAIGSTDDANTSGVSNGEVEDFWPNASKGDRAKEGGEDADLGSRTKDHGLLIRDKRTEVGGGADADEDKAWVKLTLNTQMEIAEESSFNYLSRFVRDDIDGWEDVDEDHADRNRDEEVWLVFLLDGEEKEKPTDENHDEIHPSVALEEANDSSRI